MPAAKRNWAPFRRVRYAAAVTILTGLSALGLASTVTDATQVCNETVTATATTRSCRPLQPQDPPMLFPTLTAVLLLGSDSRQLLEGIGALRLAATTRRPGGAPRKKHT